VLDPDVVLRAEPAGAAREVHGAQAVASAALGFAWLAGHAHPVLVNGAARLVAAPQGRLASVLDG
jgi:RNA polymerase sigma-70 factor, ECF subfamily